MKKILILAMAFVLCSGVVQAQEKLNKKIFYDCTVKDAEKYAAMSEGNDTALIMAASCYAVLCLRDNDSDSALVYADKGLGLAKKAVKKMPDSGRAHYLLAVLTGLQIKNDPWWDQMADGLPLVSVIVEQAQIASTLAPEVDWGGPNRVLGDVYVAAPAPPISVGSTQKAISHYKKAVLDGGDYPGNRYKLAKAYMGKSDRKRACEQLYILSKQKKPTDPFWIHDWKFGRDMYEKTCVNK